MIVKVNPIFAFVFSCAQCEPTLEPMSNQPISQKEIDGEQFNCHLSASGKVVDLETGG